MDQGGRRRKDFEGVNGWLVASGSQHGEIFQHREHNAGRLVMKAADIMTHSVVSVQPDATMLQAAHLMLQHRISGLPVVDSDGHIVGIVTEGDFLRRVETGTQRQRPRWVQFLLGPGRLAEEYVHSSSRRVEDVMTQPVHTIGEDTPLSDVVELMERHRVKRLPVLRDHKLVGIVSRANLLHALASLARDIEPTPADDEAIRECLLTELNQQSWAPLGLIDIIVRNGTVELWGTLLDERKRRALILAAENVRGVKGVRDHLVCVEPISGMAIGPPDQASST
jgi:CBS domain-containing protein